MAVLKRHFKYRNAQHFKVIVKFSSTLWSLSPVTGFSGVDFRRFQEELAGIKNTERRQIPLSSPENLELINHFDQRHKEVEGV